LIEGQWLQHDELVLTQVDGVTGAQPFATCMSGEDPLHM
jgi:hypothetical protein